MHRISIIGIGRMGGSLAIALSANGLVVRELIHREGSTPESIARLVEPFPDLVIFGSDHRLDSDVILITTADPEISNAAGWIKRNVENSPVVLHTSGSLSSDILNDLRTAGCSVGSMHPLISISDPIRGAESFSGAYFCIEGDDRAVSTAETLVAALGGESFTIETRNKALYHAAAVVSCGHLVALHDAAMSMLSACGISEIDAKKVLMPLIQSTIENFAEQDNEQALTGSFARGDSDAVERHIESIKGMGDLGILEIYLTLGERSLKLAERTSVDPDKIQMIREKIFLAKERPKC